MVVAVVVRVGLGIVCVCVLGGLGGGWGVNAPLHLENIAKISEAP